MTLLTVNVRNDPNDHNGKRKGKVPMPKKILIIDDDPIVVKYLEAVFSDNGYETCTASSTMEGLDVVKQEKPDLITLDLQMPGEWGPRFYRKLRKDKDLRDTPVIVVSGIDGDHAIKDAIAFVKKPFDPEKLVGIVKNTIG
jgi:CheY-like chemotaxis protein